VLGEGLGEDRPRVVLVRHGQTEWSRTHRHTSTTDLPLEPEGEAEACRLAPLLARTRWARVLTSPLRRAVETCRLAGLGERAETCSELAEWSYGDYEGRTTSDIRRERPGWRLWTDGAPGGETPDQVAARVDRVIASIRGETGDVAVFAHGHVLRVLAARWVGLGPEGGACLALGAGRLSRLGWEHEEPVVELWNASELD
jgi:broad specificity phosphatase PhoE